MILLIKLIKIKSEIKIFDGNSGPIRDISLIDWGVHAFGIVNFLLSFDMHIKKTRVLNRLNSMQLNYYF